MRSSNGEIKIVVNGQDNASAVLTRISVAGKQMGTQFVAMAQTATVSADKLGTELAETSRHAQTAGKEMAAAAEKSRSAWKAWGADFSKDAAAFAAGQVGFQAALTATQSAFKGTVGAAIEYERQLNVMRAESNATAAQMAQISAKAKELGNDLTLPGVSAIDATAAMRELAKAGLSINDTIGASKGVLQLAAAGQLSHAQAAEIAANALNMFNLAGTEATRVADLLAAAAVASSADVKDVADSFKMAGSIFASMQGDVVGTAQSMNTLTTAIAVLANQGIKGSDAGTALKQSLLQLAAPSDKAKGIMRDLAESIGQSGDIAYTASGQMRPYEEILKLTTQATSKMTAEQRDFAVTTIFGADAARVVIPLMRSMGETAKGTAQSWDTVATAVSRQGAASELAGAQMQGLGGTIAAIQSSVETLGLEIGQALLPGLAGIATALAQGVSSDGFQQLSGVITTMASGVGSLAGLFLSLNNPISIATAATLGLHAAFALIAANPVAVAIGVVATGVVYLSGKLAEANQQVEALNQKVMGAGASATQTYAAALKQIGDAGGDAATKQAYLTKEAERLHIAYGQGTNALNDATRALKTASDEYGKNSIQAKAAQQEVDRLTQNQINLYGSLQTVNGALRDNGASLQRSAETANAAQAQMANLKRETEQAGQASQALEDMRKALQEVASDAGKATKEINKLVSPPTGGEVQVAAQIDAITAAQKNLEAATRTGGQAQTDFLDQTREWLATAKLAPEVLADANRVLDAFAEGNLSAKDANAQLEKVLAPTAESLGSVAEALSSTRDAIGSAAEAEIDAARNWNGTMEDRKSSTSAFVDLVLGRFPELAPAAQTAATDTNAAMQAIGGPDIAATVQANTITVGSYAADGIIIGWGQRIAGVEAQMYADVARLAQIQIPKAAGVESPSKYTIRVGGYLADGTAIGWGRHWPRVVREMTGDMSAGVAAVVAVAQVGASDLAVAVAGIAQGPLKGLRDELAATGLQLAQMRRELATLDSKSEAAKGLRDQIQDLVAYRQELGATIRMQRDAGTAVEAFGAAMTRAIGGFDIAVQFGDQGTAAIDALRAAFESGEPEAGDAMASAVLAIVEEARAAGLPAWREFATDLWDTFARAAEEKTPEAVQAALDALTRVRGRMAGGGFAKAFADAARLDQLKGRFGQAGAEAMLALERAITEQTPDAGAAAFEAVRRITEEAREAGIQGWQQLGQDLAAAASTALETGDFNSFNAMLERTSGILRQLSPEFRTYTEALLRLPGAAMQVAQTTGLQRDAIVRLRSAYGDATRDAGVFGSALTDLKVMMADVQKAAIPASTAIGAMFGAAGAGSAEMSQWTRQSDALKTVNLGLQAINSETDPARITQYTGMLRQMMQTAGVPESVIDSVLRLNLLYKESGNLAGEANQKQIKANEEVIASRQKALDQFQQETADMQKYRQTVFASTKEEEDYNRELNARIAIREGQATTEQRAIKALQDSNAELGKQKTGIAQVDEILAPYINKWDTGTAFLRGFLDVQAKNIAATQESLPVFHDLTATIGAFGEMIGGGAFMSKWDEWRQRVKDTGEAAGVVTDNLGELPEAATDASKGLDQTGKSAQTATGQLGGYTAALSTAFSQYDVLGTQAAGGGRFVGWSFTGGFEAALNDGIPQIAAKVNDGGIVIATALARGLAVGVEAASAEPIAAVERMSDDMIAALKKRLGIASPSKVAHREVGVPIPQGVAGGVIAATGEAITAVVYMSDAVMRTATAKLDTFMVSLSSGGTGGAGPADHEQVPGQPPGVTYGLLRHLQAAAAGNAPGELSGGDVYADAAEGTANRRALKDNKDAGYRFTGEGQKLAARVGKGGGVTYNLHFHGPVVGGRAGMRELATELNRANGRAI